MNSLRQPWYKYQNNELTLKALGLCSLNPFRVDTHFGNEPRVVAALQPWAGIS